jgi:hypothetical protein
MQIGIDKKAALAAFLFVQPFCLTLSPVRSLRLP